MHSPRHSFGASNAQPSTPCSASTECGGSRSTFAGSASSAFLRRAFFRSARPPPWGSIESITAQADRIRRQRATKGCRALLNASSPVTHSNVYSDVCCRPIHGIRVEADIEDKIALGLRLNWTQEECRQNGDRQNCHDRSHVE